MIGKSGVTIGSLHNIPAPSALVLGESLKLLATFGDKKAISALLETVREVQAHNEQVFRDAQTIMGELSTERKALDDSRKAFAIVKAEQDDINNQRASALSQADARLSGKVAAFANEQAALKSALDEKEKRLADMERSLGSREYECKARESELSERTAGQDKNEKELSARFAQLIEKERKLRAALSD
jgi:uncharacterized protein (DUF3084 family)